MPSEEGFQPATVKGLTSKTLFADPHRSRYTAYWRTASGYAAAVGYATAVWYAAAVGYTAEVGYAASVAYMAVVAGGGGVCGNSGGSTKCPSEYIINTLQYYQRIVI